MIGPFLCLKKYGSIYGGDLGKWSMFKPQDVSKACGNRFEDGFIDVSVQILSGPAVVWSGQVNTIIILSLFFL